MSALRPTYLLGLLGLFAFVGSSCGDAEPPAPPAPPPKAAQVSPEPALPQGTIRGIVELAGEAPARRPIAMGTSPECSGHATPPLSENVVAVGGKLANVLVSVKEGLPRDGSWPPPAEDALLDQKGCLYTPHVLALRAGQTLRIRNSDPTTHNVNAKPSRSGNEGFNRMQAPGAGPVEVVFATPELAIPVGCDVHPWMGAWVHVLEHPFFAVSSSSGEFELGGLPAGRYRLEAQHETLGKQTFEVELGPTGGVQVVLTFAAQRAK
jgi:hypothetical protein